MAKCQTIFSALIFFSTYAYGNMSVQANFGMVNIVAEDISRHDFIEISGDWEFVANKLVDPDSFKKMPLQKVPLYPVPQIWGVEDGIFFGANNFGSGTYRLKINFLTPPDPDKPIILQMAHIPSAFKLWVNGRLLQESGVVAINREEEKPQYGNLKSKIENPSQSLEIVLQVSNHHHFWGGTRFPLTIGHPNAVMEQDNRLFVLSLIFVGAGTILFLYHSCLFWIHGRSLPVVLISILFVVIVVRPFILEGNLLFDQFFSEMNWHSTNLMQHILFGITVPLSLMLIHSLFPSVINPAIIGLNYGALFLYVLSGMTPIGAYYPVVYPILIGTFVGSTVYALFCSMWYQYENSYISMLQFFAIMALIFTVINDGFGTSLFSNPNYRIHSIWSLAGLLIFALIQSLHLTSKLSTVFTKASQQEKEVLRLNFKLKEHIKFLDQQIDDAGHRLIQQEKLSAIGHLAAGIAFELNNPMAIIQGYSHNLTKVAARKQLTPALLSRSQTGILSAIS